MRRGRHLPFAAALAVVAALLGGGGAACGGFAADSPSPPAPADAVILRVDGVPVTQADIEAIRAERRLAGVADDEEATKTLALRRLLVRREAERRGLDVAEKAVAARRSQLTQHMGGPAQMAAALEAASVTDAQLDAALRYGLVEKAVAAALFPQKQAKAAEVAAFYRKNRERLFSTAVEVRLRRLTVPNEALARRIAAEIAAGTSFAAAAQRYSMDNETRYDGGMLGWISLPTLPAEVRSALAPLAPGELSAPVRSLGRWHLFRLLDRHPARVVPFSRARPAVRTELTRRRQTAALDEWVETSLTQATITEGP